MLRAFFGMGSAYRSGRMVHKDSPTPKCPSGAFTKSLFVWVFSVFPSLLVCAFRILCLLQGSRKRCVFVLGRSASLAAASVYRFHYFYLLELAPMNYTHFTLEVLPFLLSRFKLSMSQS